MRIGFYFTYRQISASVAFFIIIVISISMRCGA
jgi:hypothetical protein